MRRAINDVESNLSNFIENSDESSSVLSSSGSQEVEHTASNDISERSSGDEESVYNSPEQNGSNSLGQKNNASVDDIFKEKFTTANFKEVEFQSTGMSIIQFLVEESSANDSLLDSTSPQKDEEGCILLHYEAVNGNNEVVKTLLEGGADVNHKNKHGCTPLHDAALEGHNEVVKTLLERGANVNALNNRKNSPFILAEEKSNHGVIEILKNENVRLCRNYCEILEMQPGTNLNDVRLANQMRRRSQSF